MNRIFPKISKTYVKDASPGSIIRVPRGSNSFIALVTSEKAENGTPSILFLNLVSQDEHRITLAQSWRLDDPCLHYEDTVCFDLDTDPQFIDQDGGEWWQTAGTIVPIGSRMFIRAAVYRGFRTVLVDLQSGDISTRNDDISWGFGKWKLSVKGAHEADRILLCEFSAAKKSG